jgi:hypothetical protein
MPSNDREHDPESDEPHAREHSERSRRERDEPPPVSEACSFCGHPRAQVRKLIRSSIRPGIYICEECVDLCNEIIVEEIAELGETTPGWWRWREVPPRD